jgi:hypothetical protein
MFSGASFISSSHFLIAKEKKTTKRKQGDEKKETKEKNVRPIQSNPSLLIRKQEERTSVSTSD